MNRAPLIVFAGLLGACASRVELQSSWFFVKGQTDVETAAQPACDECLALHVGLLNVGPRTLTLSELRFPGAPGQAVKHRLRPELTLQPGGIHFIMLASLPEHSQVWGCRLPVNFEAVANDGSSIGLEMVNAMPTSIPQVWRVRCMDALKSDRQPGQSASWVRGLD